MFSIFAYDINNGSMDRQVLVISLQYHNHKLRSINWWRSVTDTGSERTEADRK